MSNSHPSPNRFSRAGQSALSAQSANSGAANAVDAQKPKRMDWVDIAKGLSIILVVMYHSTLGVGDALGEVGFMHWVIAFATPFRMPEFFLLSGLFLAAVIARPWAQFADRRAVHYLYFYFLWAILQIVVKVGLGSGDPATALSYALYAVFQPYGVLWFIYMLAVFGIVAKLLHQFKVPHWAAFGVAALLQILPVHTPLYAIDMFAEYFVFFYAGYWLAPRIFTMVEYVQKNRFTAILAIALWASLNGTLVFSAGFVLSADNVELGLAGLPIIRLMLAMLGALAVCAIAGVLSTIKFGNLLRWLGENSIIIYLSFVIPMAITRTILVKLGIVPDAGLMSVLVIVVAMGSPLVLNAIIQRIGFGKFLFQRPAWAHLPGTPGSRWGQGKPAPNPNSVPAE